MKFKKFFEAPWVDTPDHGTFDLGLELLGGDKNKLIDKVRNIFLGNKETGAHGSTIQLTSREEKENFKQELLDDVIFLSYCRKMFRIPEQKIINIIDTAIEQSEAVTVEETTRDNTHDRNGLLKKMDQHYLKPKQDIPAINRMARPFGKNLAAWEDIKSFQEDEQLDEIKAKNIWKYMTSPKFRRKHRDATVNPSERNDIDDQIRNLAHKHQPVSSDIDDIPHDEYYFSPEYKEKMRSVLRDVLGDEHKFRDVMSNPEKKKNFSKIYTTFKKNVKGGLSGVLKALGLGNPSFLQTEGVLIEDTKLFGISFESIEEKVKEFLKGISEKVLDRKYETIAHKYPEEAEEASNRSIGERDLIGALVHKGSERALDFDLSIEEGIRKAIVAVANRIDSLMYQTDIDELITYITEADFETVDKFIDESFKEKQLEWVVLFRSIKELMEETSKVTPGAYR